jgi:hypothetical protein
MPASFPLDLVDFRIGANGQGRAAPPAPDSARTAAGYCDWIGPWPAMTPFLTWYM